jgi:SsrA-binding protein
MIKKKPSSGAIVNRRARFDYQLGDEIVTGLALSGPEVRAARDGHIQLKGAYVALNHNELWLHNASFSLQLNQKGESNARTVDITPRKLLASRKQIDSIAIQKKAGFTIVPIKLLNKGRYIKLVIALGKGKKRYDKRQSIKKRDLERETKKGYEKT